MPRAARSLNAFNARGLRQMVAGMVLLSMAVGLVAIVAVVALSLPTWMAFVAYPVVCSMTLVLTAALRNIRTGEAAANRQMVRSQA